jgi:hypothetical protein
VYLELRASTNQVDGSVEHHLTASAPRATVTCEPMRYRPGCPVGISRAASLVVTVPKAIMRQLPVVQFKGLRKVYVPPR